MSHAANPSLAQPAMQQHWTTRIRPFLPLGLVIGLGLVLVCMVVSITFGAASIRPETVWAALVAYDGSTEHLIIRTLRVPRALSAVLVGASLAVAGAIMQAITRNPLASPGLLGINAGAAFAVVLAIFLLKTASLLIFVWFAFAGAAVAAVVVYLLGAAGRGGVTPLKLVLAGAALTALLSSLTTALLILNQRTLDEVRFWLAGSVAGRTLDLFLQALPFLTLGLIVAFILGRQLTTLGLGDDIAAGLGMRTGLVKAAAALCVILLAGGSVALAGPIGFIGLVVPHLVRFLVGVDYRWLVPYAAICGGILLVLADLAARMLIRPQELPVGVLTAVLGAPLLIALVRTRLRGK